MGFVLTALHEEFPDLRIYSFDYNINIEAIDTLRSIYDLSATLPAVVINGDPYYRFRPLNELIESVPALARLKLAEGEALQRAATTSTTSER